MKRFISLLLASTLCVLIACSKKAQLSFPEVLNNAFKTLNYSYDEYEEVLNFNYVPTVNGNNQGGIGFYRGDDFYDTTLSFLGKLGFNEASAFSGSFSSPILTIRLTVLGKNSNTNTTHEIVDCHVYKNKVILSIKKGNQSINFSASLVKDDVQTSEFIQACEQIQDAAIVPVEKLLTPPDIALVFKRNRDMFDRYVSDRSIALKKVSMQKELKEKLGVQEILDRAYIQQGRTEVDAVLLTFQKQANTYLVYDPTKAYQESGDVVVVATLEDGWIIVST